MDEKLLICGTSGFAKQCLPEILSYYDSPVFFNNIENIREFKSFPVINSDIEVINFIESGRITHFVIAIAESLTRYNLTEKFLNLGLKEFKLINQDTWIPKSCEIKENVVILRNCILEEDTKIGYGSVLNIGVKMFHDSSCGVSCQLGPNTTLLGNSKVGDFTFMGANSVVLPNISVGSNCIIGAGSIVNKSIPDNSVAYGNPCKVKRKNIL